MEGTLHDIMFSRISCVLKRYEHKYGANKTVFLPPYQLTSAAVTSLVEVWGLVSDLSDDRISQLQAMLNTCIAQVLSRLQASHAVLDIKWEDEDYAMSDQGIPEPTNRGALKIAKTINSKTLSLAESRVPLRIPLCSQVY